MTLGTSIVEMVLLIGGWVWIVFAHHLKSIKDLALRVMATPLPYTDFDHYRHHGKLMLSWKP